MRWPLAITLALTGMAQAQQDVTPQITALLQSHVAEACENGAGTFGEGIYFRDLTGDQQPDLILDHGGINCTQGFGRSGFCGAQVCSVHFYVNRNGQLEHVTEVLAIVNGISDTPVPLIALYGHGGPVTQWRWNGATFENIGE